MQKQSTATIVIVSPDYFGFNPQTAGDKSFQQKNSYKFPRKNLRKLQGPKKIWTVPPYSGHGASVVIV